MLKLFRKKPGKLFFVSNPAGDEIISAKTTKQCLTTSSDESESVRSNVGKSLLICPNI